MPAKILVITSALDGQGCPAGLEDDELVLTNVATLADAVRSIVAQPPEGILALVETAGAPELCDVLRALGDFALIVACQGLSPQTATACLDRGADAALALPMPAQELSARVRSVLRRCTQERLLSVQRRSTAGDLVVELDAHQAWWRGAELDLTPTEFQLLAVLAENPGGVVSNRELLRRVWGEEYTDDVHYVRLYVGYLRDKLEDDPHQPRVIVNQWGVGYRLALGESRTPVLADGALLKADAG